MSKLSEEYKEKLHNLGKPVEEVINELPVKTLLRIGKRVCSTDYAVRFYNNKNHPQFYHNKEHLQQAIRRAWAVGAFEHREQILDILEGSSRTGKDDADYDISTRNSTGVMTDQLITHIRRTRIDPVSGNPIDLWIQVGWVPEIPLTPEEAEAELLAYYDKWIAPDNIYRKHKVTWEEYRDDSDRDFR